MGNKKVDVKEFYRIAWREMASISGERTIMSSIIPKDLSCIHTIQVSFLKNNFTTCLNAGITSSTIVDFLFRFIGAGHIKLSFISFIPQITNDRINQLIVHRALRLNCLTSFYAELWEELSIGIQKDSFS
ncbi:MAG: hypothetical protein IPL26_12710 [Leptospiraceae bacterium]|nr:hypothetical protein [Leptospiraceae bacterium]